MTNKIIPINYDLLRDTCLAQIEDFAALPGFSTHVTQDGIYYFKDNGSQVLAVAHLDSVQDTAHFHKIDIKGKDYVFNAQLDDRLGAYTILYLLPSLGFNCDILLTEGEEMGRSTAAHFETEKKYNWMFSFDRRGDDVVMYQYDGKFARRKLKEADLKPGDGSFSDIAFLDHLKCLGFNVGSGYDNEHSAWAIMDVAMYQEQVRKFTKFYNLFKDLHMYYRAKPRTYVYNTRGTGRGDVVYGNEWARHAQGWGDEWDNWEDQWKWDTTRKTWVRKEKSRPILPVDTTLEDIDTNFTLCEICQLPPHNEHEGVYIGSQYICDVCIPHAGQCSICHNYVLETTLIDEICQDCMSEINADLDAK
jgi:hypothetical protein